MRKNTDRKTKKMMEKDTAQKKTAQMPVLFCILMHF